MEAASVVNKEEEKLPLLMERIERFLGMGNALADLSQSLVQSLQSNSGQTTTDFQECRKVYTDIISGKCDAKNVCVIYKRQRERRLCLQSSTNC